MAEQRIKQTQAIKDFEHEVLNIMGTGPEEFVEYILNDHRTLQQNMGRIVAELIKGWAEDAKAGRYDLRNEATVLWAQKVMEEAPPFPMPFI